MDKKRNEFKLCKTRKGHENLAGYLFLLPSLTGFLGFIFLPMLFSLFLSFTKWSFISGFAGMEWKGLANFTALFQDIKFIASLKNTFLYTLYTVPVSLLLGFAAAIIIHDFTYGKTLLKISIFLPYISSLVAISVVWKVILHPASGPVNQFLSALGVTNLPGWFGSSKWALLGIAIETVWIQIGYNVVLYMAGFTGISGELYDAAAIDGCNAWQKIRYITIPGVAPTTFFLTIMAMISSFKVFDQVSVITQGGPGDSTMVLAYYIYQKAFTYYDMGYASAMAWVLFSIILVITLIQWKFGNKKDAD